MDATELFELKGKGIISNKLLKQYPTLPSDHGAWYTKQDIENLIQHTGATESTHVAPNGNYKLLSIFSGNATDTVLLIPSGDQYPYCIDSKSYPNGFLIPGNLLDKWKKYNINVILLIPPYTLDYGWGTMAGNRKTFYNLTNKLLTSKIKNKVDKENFFIKILNFYQDLNSILKDISQKQKIWTVGHCTSADILARYSSVKQFVKPHGIVMWNPQWRIFSQSADIQAWQTSSKIEKYFETKTSSHLLVVQHKQDKCPCVSVNIAKKIVDDSNSKYKKLEILDGGTDAGLPCFSMGYHGFAGIEEQLVKATARFINNSLN
jgi:hypothetical protein